MKKRILRFPKLKTVNVNRGRLPVPVSTGNEKVVNDDDDWSAWQVSHLTDRGDGSSVRHEVRVNSVTGDTQHRGNVVLNGPVVDTPRPWADTRFNGWQWLNPVEVTWIRTHFPQFEELLRALSWILTQGSHPTLILDKIELESINHTVDLNTIGGETFRLSTRNVERIIHAELVAFGGARYTVDFSKVENATEGLTLDRLHEHAASLNLSSQVTFIRMLTAMQHDYLRHDSGVGIYAEVTGFG